MRGDGERRVPSLVFAPRLAHSERPMEVKTRIDHFFRDETSKTEVLARTAPDPSCSYWGNESPGFPNVVRGYGGD
jgi:hypothetical protein